MNNATAMAMFYVSVQTMAEQQGCAATLARLDFMREWLERIQNNGHGGHAGRCLSVASGEEIHRVA
jgi:hypothetical protein